MVNRIIENLPTYKYAIGDRVTASNAARGNKQVNHMLLVVDYHDEQYIVAWENPNSGKVYEYIVPEQDLQPFIAV